MKNLYSKKISAFTLVEMVVVITILAILSTFGFLSYDGYSISSRDTVRVSDLRSIDTSLQLEITKSGKVPTPDNRVTISASGSVITYQGYAGTGVLAKIGISDGGKDPVDNNYYTYATNRGGTQFQLLGYFEQQSLTYFGEQTYADLEFRFPRVYGDELGIIINSTTQEPIQNENNDIDIINTTDEYKIVVNNSTDGTFTGTGGTIINSWTKSINAGSCAEILENFPLEYLENGEYSIVSNTGEKIKVFCDMDNGGFTGLFSVDPGSTTWKFDSTQWGNPIVSENDFLTQETTYNSYKDFNASEIRICRGDLESCYTMNHGANIPLHRFYSDNMAYIDFSRFYINNGFPLGNARNINGPENIGPDNQETLFTNLGVSDIYNPIDYNKYGFGININPQNRLGFQGDSETAWPNADNYGLGIGVFKEYPVTNTTCNSPVNTSRALSVLISGGPCFYDNPDSQMWYVLGR